MDRIEETKLREQQVEREMTAIERMQDIKAYTIEKNIDRGVVEALPYKSAVMKKMIKVIDAIINHRLDSHDDNTHTSVQAAALREILTVVDLSVLIADYILSLLVLKPSPFSTVCRGLNNRIIKAYQMSVYIKEHPYYYKEMTRFLGDNLISGFEPTYKRFKAGARINRETLEDMLAPGNGLGTGLLALIVKHPDSFVETVLVPISKTRTHKYIHLSASLTDLMADIIESNVSNTFDRIPMVCTPYDWKKQSNGKYAGGFMTQHIRDGTPLFSGKRHMRLPKEVPQPYLDALNKLQRTPFTVNEWIFNVTNHIFRNNLDIAKIPRADAKELDIFPDHEVSPEMTKQLKAERREIHVDNIKAFSKGITLMTSLKQCKDLIGKKLHFVFTLDYRGRIYCMSSGLNIQGSDMIKSLLHFNEAKAVGEDGLYWLKIRAANTLGQDKLEPDDRVALVDKLIKDGTYEKIAQNPIDERDLWKDADKPLQYLATVYELATAYRLKDPRKHLSRLPVGLDGSCNGSQHLAVLSQDKQLAHSVNVLPNDTCKDIYQDVVDDVYKDMYTEDNFKFLQSKKCEKEDIKYTIGWLSKMFEKPPRKLVKRPVMTMPYGATLNAYMAAVREFLKPYELLKKNKMVIAIVFMIDKALKSKSGGAVKAMAYIQKAAIDMVKDIGTFKYTTALGMEVDCYKPMEDRRAVCIMGYMIKVNVPLDKPNLRAIKACSAPNFIHSLDSCHLIMTINTETTGCVLPCHDDIGTYPSETQALYDTLRETWIDLYKDKDYLKEISDTEFDYGEGFNIEEVRDSKHFFL